MQQYRTLQEVEGHLGCFIADLNNTDRLHSSSGYPPPAEFEAARRAAETD